MEQKKEKSITIWGYSEGCKIDLQKKLIRDFPKIICVSPIHQFRLAHTSIQQFS